MDNDKLREYIRDNRSAIDDLRAPADLWGRIEPEIDPKPKGYLKWITIAIAAIILGSVGYYVGQNQKVEEEKSEIQNFLDIQEEALQYANIPDFKETQQYYEMEVVQVLNQLKSKNVGDELLQDLKQLEIIEQELYQELQEAEGIYKEHVLQAMIQNQQTKLNLLLNVLNELKHSDDQKQKIYENI